MSYKFKLEGFHVACGSYALAYNGLTTYSWNHPDLMTSYKELDGVNLYYLSYYYFDKIDYCFRLRRIEESSFILMPSKERAIVEYVLGEKWRDEGILLEALTTYLQYFYDDSELWTVARHFDLAEKELRYWLGEARKELELG